MSGMPLILFAKKSKNNKTPRNNKAQNKQFRDVARKLNLNKDQQQELHRDIHGQGYGYQEMLEAAWDLFGM